MSKDQELRREERFQSQSQVFVSLSVPPPWLEFSQVDRKTPIVPTFVDLLTVSDVGLQRVEAKEVVVQLVQSE